MYYSFGTQECDQSFFNREKGGRNHRITAAIQQLFRVYRMECKYHKGPIYQLEDQLKTQFFVGIDQFNHNIDSLYKVKMVNKQQRSNWLARQLEQSNENIISRFINNTRKKQKKQSLLNKPLIRKNPFKSRSRTGSQKIQNYLPISADKYRSQIKRQDAQKGHRKSSLEPNNDLIIPSQYEVTIDDTFKSRLQAQNNKKLTKHIQQKYQYYNSPNIPQHIITEPARPLSRSKNVKLHLNKRKENTLKSRELLSLQRRTDNQNRNRILKLSKQQGPKESMDSLINKKNSQEKDHRRQQKRR